MLLPLPPLLLVDTQTFAPGAKVPVRVAPPSPPPDPAEPGACCCCCFITANGRLFSPPPPMAPPPTPVPGVPPPLPLTLTLRVAVAAAEAAIATRRGKEGSYRGGGRGGEERVHVNEVVGTVFNGHKIQSVGFFGGNVNGLVCMYMWAHRSPLQRQAFRAHASQINRGTESTLPPAPLDKI